MLTYAYLADLESLPNGDCITEASADLKSGTYPTGGEKGLRAGAGACGEGVGRCTHYCVSICTLVRVKQANTTPAFTRFCGSVCTFVGVKQVKTIPAAA
jgi:hypothetical protein